MTPTWKILVGDVRDTLKTVPDQSVQCCVTSPPYWGLRDYGCEGQLGLEATPDAYVASMVEVFREVKRCLRDDATLWINIGDSFSDKQRQGIPWRLAFALQADGWYLRSDIIWSKPNPMPESVTDRPTKAHEYIFLLTKSARYFYDADAVREAQTESSFERSKYDRKADKTNKGELTGASRNDGGKMYASGLNALPYTLHPAGRNCRSVWTITTQPYPDAHFATFPEALPERCIKAGTSERGACPQCGAGWVRVVSNATGGVIGKSWGDHSSDAVRGNNKPIGQMAYKTYRPGLTTGWQPSCSCPPAEPVPCVVLDNFTGSGTTGQVAIQLGRSFIGCELSEEYATLAKKRIGGAAPLFAVEVA